MIRYLLLVFVIFQIHLTHSQSIPTRQSLKTWEDSASSYKTSDSVLFHTYIDSIKTQLLDRTDTAHYWTGKYHLLLASKVWKNPNVEWLKFHYAEAYEAFKKAENQDLIAYSLDRLGRAYVHARKYDSARIYLLEAYQLAQNTNSFVLKSDVLGSLSMLYFYSEDYEEALIYMKQFLIGILEENDTTKFAGAFNNLAATYYRLNQYDSSLSYHKKSLAIALATNSKIDIGFSYLNFGEIFANLGAVDSAVFYTLKSKSIFESFDYKWGIASSSMILGKAYSAIGNTDKALLYLSEAVTSAREIKDIALLRDAFDAIIPLYKKSGNFKKAFSFLEERVEIKDSLDNTIKRKELDELITKYETEKKEQQIFLQSVQLSEKEAQLAQNRLFIISLTLGVFSIIGLWLLNRNRLKKKQQITLQQERLNSKEAEINATISSQEKERARYARDLHDGFGQMISVLNMNLKSLEDGAKPDDRQKVFENSSQVIDEMYGELKNICFDLMPQTLIKHGLESALNEFSGRINQTGKVFIDLNVFGLDQRLSELQEISLYRISQEWVNNILKYSDADKISLQITKDEDEITLLIEDNGSGFDKSLLKQGKGNGWKNLNTRAKLIQGELELETNVGMKGNVLILNASMEIAKKEVSAT